MKRLYMWLFCVVSGLLTAWATPQIKLNTTEGRPGEEVTVRVGLDRPEQVTAVEIVLPLDPALTYVEGSAKLMPARIQDHNLSAAVVKDQLRLYIYSLSLKPLQGESGDLVEFKLKLGEQPVDWPLEPKVVLSDAAGQAVATEVLPGKVQILAPQLTIDNPEIDFGRVPIRSIYTQSLQLRNSGTETVEVTDITTTAAELQPERTTLSIAPSTTEYVTLQFAPQKRGDWQAQVKVLSNATNGAQEVQLKAQPFSVNELHVDRAEGQANQDIEVVLRMNNMEPIVGLQCSFEMPDGLEYVPNSFVGASRAAKHTASSTLKNNRLTLFLHSPANAALEGTDGEIGRFKVRQKGQVWWSCTLTPTDVILSNRAAENMTSAVYGNEVVIQSPTFSGESSLAMGEGPLTQPLTARYTLRNDGQINLTVDKVTFLAEGYAVKTPLPLVVPPSDSRELEFAYQGQQAGDFGTTMNLYTNDPAHRMQAVEVKGRLYEPNQVNLRGENLENGDYRWTIGLDNFTDIVAIQMDLHWLPGMKTGLDQLKTLERLKSHAFTLAQIDAQTVRVVIYSMNNQVIPGKSGDLFTLTYHPEGEVAFRDSPLTIDKIVLSNAKGENFSSAVQVEAPAEFDHFTIRFVADGQVIQESFLKVGDKIQLPITVPSKPGCTFESWGEVPEVMPAHDVECQAVFALLPPKFSGVDTLNLGTVYSGVQSHAVYRVKNEGEDDLVIKQVTFSQGGFSVSNPLPLTLPKQAEDDLNIDFTTFGTRPIDTRMMLQTNDPEQPVVRVQLKGQVEEANPFTIQGQILENGDYRWTISLKNQLPLNGMQLEVSWIPGMRLEQRDVALVSQSGTADIEVIPLTTDFYQVTVQPHEAWAVSEEERPVFTMTYHPEAGTQFRDTELQVERYQWKEPDRYWTNTSYTYAAKAVVDYFHVRYKVGDRLYHQDFLQVGAPIVPPAEEPVRKDHAFSGWGDVPEVMPDHDVEFQAIFTILPPKFSGDSELSMGEGMLGSRTVVPYGVYNAGIDTLVIDRIDFDDAGFRLENPLPLKISKGSIESLQVRCARTQPGPYTATMQIHTNDVSTPVHEVQISGSMVNGNFVHLAGENIENGGYQWTVSMESVKPVTAVQFDFHWLPGMQTAADLLRLADRLTGWNVQVTPMEQGTTRIRVTAPQGTSNVGGKFDLFALAYQPHGDLSFRDTPISLDGFLWTDVEGLTYTTGFRTSATATFNHFTVRFMADGTVFHQDFLQVGAPIQLPESNPVKDGYAFEGWGEVLEFMPDYDVAYEALFRLLLPKFNGASTLDMGTGNLSESLTGNYRVTNTGEAPLIITEAQWTGEGFSLQTALPLTVGVGQSQDLSISYLGQQAGTVEETLTLTTNDPDVPTYSVKLTAALIEGNQLTLQGENLENGDYRWTVELLNEKPMTSLQFDLHWLSGMQTSVEQLRLAEALAGWNARLTPMEQGISRIQLTAPEGTVIPDGKSTLFTLTYHPQGEILFRDTELTLDGFIWSDASGMAYTTDFKTSAMATFNHFTIRFLADGEVFDHAFLKVGDRIPLPEGTPVKDGYAFEGWGEVAEVMPAEDVDYDAIFRLLLPEFSGETSLDFGSGVLSETLNATYSVTNTGEAPLEVSEARLVGEGFSLQTALPLTIGVGESQILSISYLGKQAGAVEGSLTLTTNNPDVPTCSVQLSASLTENNQLTLRGENLENGDYLWTVALDNEKTMTAVQLDLYWLVGMQTATTALQLSGRAQGCSVQVTDLGEGVTRIQLTAPDDQPIAAGKGDLFTLTYQAQAGTEFRDTEAQLNHLVFNHATAEGFVSAAEATASAVFNHFTVRFLVNGEVIAQQFLEVGAPIEVPEVPEVAGYDFEGWGDVLDFMPDYDVDYEAVLIPTGIESLFVDTPFVDVYDLNGRKLKTQVAVSALTGELPIGVYIINGKKVFVK